MAQPHFKINVPFKKEHRGESAYLMTEGHLPSNIQKI